MADEKHNLITWLGFTTEPDFSKARLLGHAIGYGFVTLYLCVFALLVGGLMWTITHVPDIIDDVIYAKDPSEARWLLASLAALTAVTSAAVALPFTVLKTIYNRRQTEVAEQSHITDQINKAVENLGATRLEKRIIETPQYKKDKESKDGWLRDIYEELVPATRPDGQPLVKREQLEVTVPNLEVRVGGILALERIAKHNLSEHIHVMEILCAFVRENTREFVATTVPLGEDGEVLFGSYIFPRHDIASALSVIARRGQAQRQLEQRLEPPYKLNFNQADFRGLKMDGCDFANALLTHANFGGADLTKATFEGASLDRTNFSNTILHQVNFCASHLHFNSFENADLWEASFNGAVLGGTNFEGAKNSATCTFVGAACFGTDLTKLDISREEFKWIFGEASCIRSTELSDETAHWLTEVVGQNLGTYIAVETDFLNFFRAWHAWQDEIGFDRASFTG